MIQIIADAVKNLILNHYREAFLFGAVLCGIYRWTEKKSIVRRNWKKYMAIFLFGIYVYFLFSLTILSRSGTYTSELNLIPFLSFQKSEWDRMYFYTNVILFFPMPVFLYVLFPVFRSFRKSIMLGFLVSAGVEITQFLFHCGWCDIDDVLSNTFGVALGWLCIWHYSCRFPGNEEKHAEEVSFSSDDKK